MNKYIGPREVWAHPMTEYEAIAAGIHPKSEDGHVLRAGYKIAQPIPNGRVLGYWVDEDTFNRCYTQFNSSADRLRVEIEEVQRRIQSWMLFDEPVPKPNEENLWRLQHDMLRAYVRILEMRLEIIKMKDGSGQHVMPAVHNTRKEAMLTLQSHITSVVEERNDDCIGDPFNYTIEEVDDKDVNERITDFECARRALGRKLNTGFHVVKEKLSKSGLPLKGVIRLLEGINPKHIEALIALNKLFTIAQAWNKEDNFVPDFSDLEQGKWFPWFVYDKDAAGFVFAHTTNAPAHAGASFGSRLCFKSSARAAQFGKQFADLYNKVFL